MPQISDPNATLLPQSSLSAVIEKLGLNSEHIEMYGRDKAKVSLEALKNPRSSSRSSKLILVSAMTPTPAGEGKTTLSIGLAQGLRKVGLNASLALREPSLGPVFGRKGTATGGGRSSLTPAASINLHFTGDFHAITSAHNLLASAIDNALHFKTTRLCADRILWKRVMDMNDRALRNIQVSLGASESRSTGFDITAASEIMAALCLTSSLADLRRRIDSMLVGFDADYRPVFAKELRVTGAMMALLKDAIKPNLVQSIEGVPCFVHGGPFANIAHGCNSVLATQMALAHSDYVVTEAGFAFDLGGEKFMNLKCRAGQLRPNVVVIVATLRALKMHGGLSKEELQAPNAAAVERGFENLKAHIEAAQKFRQPVVVAINRFTYDTPEEHNVVLRNCADLNVPCAVADVYSEGGAGATVLANLVKNEADKISEALPSIYELADSPVEKIKKIAAKIYGAEGVELSTEAIQKLELIERCGLSSLPICMAKTQDSISDNPKLMGRPRGFKILVRDFEISNGAGFLVALTGKIFRMPALPKQPAAERIDLDESENIIGW